MSLLSVAMSKFEGAQSWSPSMRCAPWSPVPSGVGSSPCDDVLVKLPSTSCAIVALDRSGAASGCLVVKSPSASVGWFRGVDVFADSVGRSLRLLCPAGLDVGVCPVREVSSLLFHQQHGVGTIPLGYMAVAVATLCMGCAAPALPDPGPGSQLSTWPSLTVAFCSLP